MVSECRLIITLQVTCSGSVNIPSEFVLLKFSAACKLWLIAFRLHVLPFVELQLITLLASHAFKSAPCCSKPCWGGTPHKQHRLPFLCVLALRGTG